VRINRIKTQLSEVASHVFTMFWVGALPMVEVIELTKVFGTLVAEDHVSFRVAEREIFTSLLVWS
jgi:hypothetical protein